MLFISELMLEIMLYATKPYYYSTNKRWKVAHTHTQAQKTKQTKNQTNKRNLAVLRFYV